MPNAPRIGLLGPLQVRDETGRPVHVGGRQLRVLLTLLALDAGRVAPAGSLAGEIWPDDLPGNPGNALQTLVSRLRAQLRQAGIDDVIESHPAGYRLAVPPEAVDVMALETLAARAVARWPTATPARPRGSCGTCCWPGAASRSPMPPDASSRTRWPPTSTVVPSPRTTRSPSLPARSRIP